MVQREIKRIKLNKKYSEKRNLLKAEYAKATTFESKIEIHNKIQKLPLNSSKIRIRNRCWKTGRPRGYYRDLLFLVMFFVKWHQCLLPGVTKSSW